MTHSFFGGVYPATRKDMTRRKPLARLSRAPQEIVIPLVMCADGPATPLVRPGDSGGLQPPTDLYLPGRPDEQVRGRFHQPL